MRSRRLLYLFTWLTEFSGFLLIFSVSRSLAEGDANLLTLGVMGGGFSLVLAASCAYFGYLSDRIGRRRMMAIGMSILIFSILGCSSVDNSHALYYAAYWSGGVALGMVYPALYAWLSASESHSHARGIGGTVVLFAVMWNLGLICGQVSGGWLFKFSVDWPLYLAVSIAVLNLVLLRVIGPSPHPATAAAGDAVSVVAPDQALSAAFVKLAWLANLGGAFSMSMVIHLFPKLAVLVGIPSDEHGAILAVTRAVVIATYFVLYRFSFWHLRLGPAIVSQLIALAGLIVISFAREPIGLLVGLIGVAQLAGFNYFASLYYSTAGSSHDRRGTASGLHEATLALGFAAGSILGGLAGDFGGPGAPYRLAAAVILTLAVVQAFVYVRHVRPLRSELPTATEAR